jgi:hypothetical protein
MPRRRDAEVARSRLGKLSGLRTYTVEGEVMPPSHEWLLRILEAIDPVKREDKRRGLKRHLIRIAKTLDLYPIPDWWLVRKKILESLTGKKISSATNQTDAIWSAAKTANEKGLMSDEQFDALVRFTRYL